MKINKETGIVLASTFLKFVRLYTFYAPIRKGKYRLFEFALRNTATPPENFVVQTKDGRRVYADWQNKIFDTMYFLGEYEWTTTEIIRRITRPGDVCFDVGANFGWYATLLARQNAGQVHAFEPVPPIFRRLEKNFRLAGSPPNLVLNRLALGDEFKLIELHVFDDLPDGHASVSTMGKKDYATFEAEMVTLDSYLEDKNIETVNFVKADIEGAEMMFLRGAKRLFRQKTPPLMVFEMALETSRHFGYAPNDLIQQIKSEAAYDFYAIDDYAVKLKKIEGFAPGDLGANVLCVPRNQYRERLSRIKIQ